MADSRQVLFRFSIAVAAAAATFLAASVAANALERCAGTAFPLLTAPGGVSPYIRLQADAAAGAFLLDYGTTRSSISRSVLGDGLPSGQDVSVAAFSLPTFKTGSFDQAEYALIREPPGGQLGIVGTDFLSLLTADFLFDGAGGDVVLSAEPCDPAILRHRGMVAISQTGFFSSDVSRVRRDLPNVPMLPLRIGEVSTWAQIDTGYDDAAFAPSIDINDALFQELLAAGIALVRVGKVGVTTCGGYDGRDVYKAPGAAIVIVDESGVLLRQLDHVKLVHKKTRGCGGIASMPRPAAQIGATILRQLRSVVFDPKAELVWILPGDRAARN